MWLWPFKREAESVAVAGRIEPKLYASSPENPETNLADPASWLSDWASGGHAGSFGPSVAERSSMCCSAVHRSVSLRAGPVAGLPLKVYKRTKPGRDEAPEHRLQPMFQVTPFPGRAMTSFIWRELWSINIDLWGDHVSIIRYDGAARIIGFEPVMPWDVEVYRINNRSVYRCTILDSTLASLTGTPSFKVEWHDQEDVIHIPGLGFNGIRGVSRIRSFARNAISLALLLEEQTGRAHENAARPSGLITVPPSAKQDGNFPRFKAQFEENHVGRLNVGKIIFGDKDTTYTPFQISQEDLNTLAFRGFQIADVSRFFGVPLHLLNETEKATSWGTGLSEQTLGFLIYTVENELGRIEAELNLKLFYGSEFYVEFDRAALMAMDPLKAAEVARTEVSFSGLLINEYRRKKNRPPVENGDEPMINSTNIPLRKIFEAGAQPRQDPLQADPIAPAPEPGAPGAEPPK